MRTIGSAPDPYTLRHRDGAGVGEPVNMDFYTQVSTALVPGESTGVFLFYGQSNIANFVNSGYTPTQAKSHMMNVYNGGVYATKEPVMSCNGSLPGSGFPLGNCTARIGDLLIAAGIFTRVIICNVAAGGTFSAQWAAGGDCNSRLKVAAARLLAAGMQPTLVIRHQGENDCGAVNAGNPAYTADSIKNNIWSEVETLRTAGITARVMVSKVARNGAATVGTTGYTTVRAAQSAAVDAGRGIIAGPDTDTYDSSYRYDDLHWNATGAAAVATLFKNAIVAALP